MRIIGDSPDVFSLEGDRLALIFLRETGDFPCLL